MSRFGDKQLREWRREQATPLPPASQYVAEPDYQEVGGMRPGNNEAQRQRALRYLFNKPSAIDDPAFCQELGDRPISSTALRRR
jgi:hypothetical protein